MDKYIPTGLRADEFRSRLEDKNKLNKKGALYVGTGNVEKINGRDCYETTALLPPLGNNNILTFAGGGMAAHIRRCK